ncbi:hypothetical protein Tco_0285857 [Tanacetum coccineum]
MGWCRWWASVAGNHTPVRLWPCGRGGSRGWPGGGPGDGLGAVVGTVAGGGRCGRGGVDGWLAVVGAGVGACPVMGLGVPVGTVAVCNTPVAVWPCGPWWGRPGGLRGGALVMGLRVRWAGVVVGRCRAGGRGRGVGGGVVAGGGRSRLCVRASGGGAGPQAGGGGLHRGGAGGWRVGQAGGLVGGEWRVYRGGWWRSG